MEQKTKFTFIFKVNHETPKKLQAIQSYFQVQTDLQKGCIYFPPGKLIQYCLYKPDVLKCFILIF